MRDSLRKTIPAALVAVCLASLALVPPHSEAADTVRIILTSNLGGRFTTEIQGQETSDPMIVLGQAILAEKQKGNAIFIDLGNAFHPGVLSRYNFGASMMDFFSFFNCRASLVSSEDLKLGIQSLEFNMKSGTTELVSANILVNGNPFFKPYIIHNTPSGKFALVGLTSKRSLFDVAEKEVYKVTLEDHEKALRACLDDLVKKGIKRIILMSGLEYQENMDIMAKFPEIMMIITGGDNRGFLLGGKIVRIDLGNGKTMVSVPPGTGYCVLTLSMGEAVRPVDIRFVTPSPIKLQTDRYRYFIERITLWKKQFIEESEKILLERAGKPVLVDAKRMAHFLRAKWHTEIGIVQNNSFTPFTIGERLSSSEVLAALTENFPLYWYYLNGSDLSELKDFWEGYTLSGLEDDLVQGYAIDENRKYSVISSQTTYEEIRGFLKKKIRFWNTWATPSDMVTRDLQKRKVLLKEDYRYLDNKLRAILDFYVSLYYDKSDVLIDKKVNVPVGEPSRSYNKWGIEAYTDITIYNRYHKFIFTPYINYARQDSLYLKNLIRGTLFYYPNVHPWINPYNKFTVDSVVAEVRGDVMPSTYESELDLIQYYHYKQKQRPVIIRDTVGASLTTKYVTGIIGLGFEKQIFQPVKPFIPGFELNLKIKYDFTPLITYRLTIDSFISFPKISSLNEEKKNYQLSTILNVPIIKEVTERRRYLRGEMINAFSFKITPIISMTFKHRLYYFQYMETRDKYLYSQYLTSFDLRTDYKR